MIEMENVSSNRHLPPHRWPSARDENCTCLMCKPHLYRHHRLNPATFRPRHHDYYTLATQAVASFSSLDVTTVQGELKIDWTKLWGECIQKKHNQNTVHEYHQLVCEILPRAMWIFQAMFLQGLLRGDKLKLRFERLPVGNLVSCRIIGGTHCVLLVVNFNHRTHCFSGGILNLSGLIQTAFRAMTHAFFVILGCFNGSSCGSVDCNILNRDNFGVTGSGRAWQILAKGIEDHGPRLLPNLGFALLRVHSMKGEARAPGGYIPSDCDLRSFCGDLTDVVRALRDERRQQRNNSMAPALSAEERVGPVIPHGSRVILRITLRT